MRSLQAESHVDRIGGTLIFDLKNVGFNPGGAQWMFSKKCVLINKLIRKPVLYVTSILKKMQQSTRKHE